MKHLISHRGNINGKQPHLENSPDYINQAIDMGFDVEIDIWYVNGVFFLGHDNPRYEISLNWILERQDKLWIHCKNHEIMVYFTEYQLLNINWFWHQEDDITLTSKRYMWVYPGKQPIKNSISVMPEMNNDDITTCLGVCSDFIQRYK